MQAHLLILYTGLNSRKSGTFGDDIWSVILYWSSFVYHFETSQLSFSIILSSNSMNSANWIYSEVSIKSIVTLSWWVDQTSPDITVIEWPMVNFNWLHRYLTVNSIHWIHRIWRKNYGKTRLPENTKMVHNYRPWKFWFPYHVLTHYYFVVQWLGSGTTGRIGDPVTVYHTNRTELVSVALGSEAHVSGRQLALREKTKLSTEIVHTTQLLRVFCVFSGMGNNEKFLFNWILS